MIDIYKIFMLPSVTENGGNTEIFIVKRNRSQKLLIHLYFSSTSPNCIYWCNSKKLLTVAESGNKTIWSRNMAACFISANLLFISNTVIIKPISFYWNRSGFCYKRIKSYGSCIKMDEKGRNIKEQQSTIIFKREKIYF